MSKKKFNYNQAVLEIEQILNDIESGEMDIDQLSDKVKQAISLINSCREKLRETNEKLDQSLKELENE